MSNFNDKQLEAIESEDKVIVVIAGAGSGKTTVLIERISRLINLGISPVNILAITFTNKAAQEMKTRLIEQQGSAAFRSTIMTFHGFSIKLIKENIHYFPEYDRNFFIIDDEDKKKIIKNILKDINQDDDRNVTDIMYAIGNAKSRALTYKNVGQMINGEYQDVYELYTKYCIKNNVFDFDDLLLRAYELLKIKEVKEKYNRLFTHVHVDEFQDTSLLQGEILRKLKIESTNLFIVGDIDQSIYTWRGAYADNIFDLIDHYEDVKIIKLEQNYRSTQEILEKANALIKNNEKRIEKNLWTENKKGRNVEYYPVSTNIDEANVIVREINGIVNYGANYDEFAVLYRYNYQARKIEEMFIKNRIPYKIYGSIRFYERAEIKDIIAYFRLFIKQEDNISMLRVINTPKRKVGAKTVDKFLAFADDNDISLYEALKELGGKQIKQFLNLIDKYKNLLEIKEPLEFNKEFKNFIYDLQYEAYLNTQFDKFKVQDKMDNIWELKEGFVQELELGNNIIDYINEINLFGKEEENDNDSVVLSTIHGVKGLEFDNVFVIGMVDGKFPKERAFDDLNEMEEERRLAYVAITRAKHMLTFTSYRFDYKYDYQAPSRFLKEIGIDTEMEEDVDNFIF